MSYSELRINARGQKDIDARLYSCVEEVGSALAIVAHPYAPLGGSQDDHVVRALAKSLAGVAGLDTVTFNYTKPFALTPAHASNDYMLVLRHMIEMRQGRYGKFVLVGYSYGTLTLPSMEILTAALPHGVVSDVRYVLVSPLLRSMTTLLTWSWQDRYAHIRQAGKPVLTIFGTSDDFSAIDGLRKTFSSGSMNAREIQGADHFWAEAGHKQSMLAAVVEFAESRNPL